MSDVSWYRRLTGEGQSGVQLLALGGPGLALLEESHLRDPRGGREGLLLARLMDGDELIDEVLYRRLAQRAEISLHGGTAVGDRLVRLLETLGFVAAEGWSPEGGLRARARVFLERARTRRQAAFFTRLLGGALDHRLREIADGLRATETGERTARLREELSSLLDRAPFGLAMARPPLVALRGPTNAGKSSLFNRLLGRDRVIVSPRPGTTRDAVEGAVELDGFPFRLLDLAGLRATEDPIELLGQAEGRRREAAADLVLDLRPATEELREPPRPLGDPRVIAVASRADELAPEERERLCGERPGLMPTSVAAEFGLGDLVRRIVARSAFGLPSGEDQPAPFEPDQVELLLRARRLALTEPELAARLLEALVPAP